MGKFRPVQYFPNNSYVFGKWWKVLKGGIISVGVKFMSKLDLLPVIVIVGEYEAEMRSHWD